MRGILYGFYGLIQVVRHGRILSANLRMQERVLSATASRPQANVSTKVPEMPSARLTSVSA